MCLLKKHHAIRQDKSRDFKVQIYLCKTFRWTFVAKQESSFEKSCSEIVR